MVFWDDMWCSDVPLRVPFPMLYRIAQRKDAILADVLGGQNGFIHWDIHFTHSIQDWQLESLHSFFALLYSANIDWNGVDKMVWKPAKNGSYEVKILLQSPNDWRKSCLPLEKYLEGESSF